MVRVVERFSEQIRTFESSCSLFAQYTGTQEAFMVSPLGNSPEKKCVRVWGGAISRQEACYCSYCVGGDGYNQSTDSQRRGRLIIPNLLLNSA